jgi:hypothetical protein
MWFLDDGHSVGKAADLIRCLEIIKRVVEPLGLLRYSILFLFQFTIMIG